ncbi:hypothetical protein ASC89_04270 [Devosia sp. Root413D1]|uniref:AAA family ATPase n=1 Tax=Devosia sp. Root413D1 TaxID=1736531 RepID=UPI0006FAEDAF|nr:AAA family ATPase [Devosia sp. Root413D1]KQW81052.1 hypothetical protein ASC89_04270 [Devosia sp. Root413D1]
MNIATLSPSAEALGAGAATAAIDSHLGGFIRSHGPPLVEQGYPIVPIKPGTKRPAQKGWQNVDYNSMDRSRMFTGYGVGVKTGSVVAVDIDSTDTGVVAKMVAWCEQKIGPTVERIGRAPRTLLVFQTSVPFRKTQSRAFTSTDGETHQIEILGAGQQFAAYAIHPDTGRPYSWPKGELTGRPVGTLPELTREQGFQLTDYFESIAPSDWTLVERSVATRNDGGDHRAGENPHADLWLLSAALAVIPTPPGFQQWNRVAMALFRATDGSEHGFALFDRWSQRGQNYGGTRERWETLARSPPDRIGAGTIIRIANEAAPGWRERAEAARSEMVQRDLARLTATADVQEAGSGQSAANDELGPGPLEIVSLDTLEGLPIPERRWIVEGLIPDRTVSDLGGDGGTGKSLLALQLAVAMATGGDWLGHAVTEAPVLYYSCEDEEDEIHRRAAAIAHSEGLTLKDLSQLHLIDQTVALTTALAATGEHQTLTMTVVFDQLVAAVAKLRPKLVVLDTRADVYSANENDRAQVRTFVQRLRQLCLTRDLAVLLLSHPSRSGMNDGSGQSGSTGWNNSIRSRLYLDRPPAVGNPDPDLRVLTPKKANYGPMSLEMTLRYQGGVFKLVGASTAVPLDWAAQNQRDDTRFLELLREVAAQGLHVNPSGGPYYAPSMFEQRDGTVTRQRWLAAMTRLFNQNRITVVPVGAPSRGMKKIVEVAA